MLFRLIVLLAAATFAARAELKVPAFTAYIEPAAGGARVSERAGVVGWDDPNQKVLWFGNFKQAGKLDCAVELRLSKGGTSKLRLKIGGEAREAVAIADAEGAATAKFGTFTIKEAGYARLELESLNPAKTAAGDLTNLVLAGPPAQDAHFNLKPRRNA